MLQNGNDVDCLYVLSPVDNEQLARSGTNCLENLAVSVGRQFFPDTWDSICQCVRSIYQATVPHELLTWRPGDTPLGHSVSTMSVSSAHSMEALAGTATPIHLPVESTPVLSPSSETESHMHKGLSVDRRQSPVPIPAESARIPTPSDRAPTTSDETGNRVTTSDETGNRVSQGMSREEQQGVIPEIEVQQPASEDDVELKASDSHGKRHSPVPLNQGEQANSGFDEVDSPLESATLPSMEDTSTRVNASQEVPQISDTLASPVAIPGVAQHQQTDEHHSSVSQKVVQSRGTIQGYVLILLVF